MKGREGPVIMKMTLIHVEDRTVLRSKHTRPSQDPGELLRWRLQLLVKVKHKHQPPSSAGGRLKCRVKPRLLGAV